MRETMGSMGSTAGCNAISGELIGQGILRARNGIFYYSPAVIMRTASELMAGGPLPSSWEDAIAAVLGRMTEKALMAEKGD